MHNKHLGVDMYYLGSVLWLLCFVLLKDVGLQGHCATLYRIAIKGHNLGYNLDYNLGYNLDAISLSEIIHWLTTA